MAYFLDIPQGSNHTDAPFNPIRDVDQHESTDSACPLFKSYLDMAGKEDDKMAERWKKDADSIILFSSVFSAVVAVFTRETVVYLKPNSQDTSTFYLESMYQLQVANANLARPSTPLTPVKPPPFSPPDYIIWVNSLWFLSLTISLTSALLAIMSQQWTRRYVRITQKPRNSPHDGARIRAFLARGVETFGFPQILESISTLIHLSLFLFFAGLLIYLFNVNHTVFVAIAWWIAISAASYVLVTFMQVLRPDSPYYAPLSSMALRVFGVGLCPVFSVLPLLFVTSKSKRFRDLAIKCLQCLRRCSQDMEKVAEEVVRESPSEIDGLILKWTFDAHALASADELDRFFNNVIGFCGSNRMTDPQRTFAKLGSGEFSSAFVAFLIRTFSSNSISESVKTQQFVMCVRIADATRVINLEDFFTKTKGQTLSRTVEVGRSLRSRGRRSDQEIGLCAQTIIADIIANVEGSNEHWVALAADQLGRSEDDIRRYLGHSNDSVLLANWIYMARQILNSSSNIIDRDMAGNAAYCILRPPSEFDIRGTLIELQHEFCDLWNEILPHAQRNGDGSVPHCILFLLRRLYIRLHEGTDDAPTASFQKFRTWTYPSCRNRDHRSRETADALIPPLSPDLTSSRPNPHPLRNSPDPLRSTTPLGLISPERCPVPSAATSQHNGTTLTPPVAPTSQHHEPIFTLPVPDSPSSTALESVPRGAPNGGLHSPADTSVNEFDPHSHRPASSSLSPATLSRTAVHATSLSDHNYAIEITSTTAHDDTEGPFVPSQPEPK